MQNPKKYSSIPFKFTVLNIKLTYAGHVLIQIKVVSGKTCLNGNTLRISFF